MDTPCSVLEMLIALAQRIEYILADPVFDDRTQQWFWGMIENLGLEPFANNDFYAVEKKYHNNIILDRLLERRYLRTGTGGLFPLRTVHEDQTKIEIWYQMMAYLDENNKE